MSVLEIRKREKINNSETMGWDSQFNTRLQGAAAVNYPEGDFATNWVGEAFDPASQARDDRRWGTTGSPAGDQDMSFIISLMVSLMNKVDEMSQEIAGLKDTVLSMKSDASSEEQDNTRENLMELTREEVKIKILQLYEQDKELDYYDIISRCDIDLELVVQICAELENEGRIEVIE